MIAELFESVMGEDVFSKKRTRDIADKRLVAYVMMRQIGLSYRRIADITGRTHATIISGVKRFIGLLESGDMDAINLYVSMHDKLMPILTEYGCEFPTQIPAVNKTIYLKKQTLKTQKNE